MPRGACERRHGAAQHQAQDRTVEILTAKTGGPSRDWLNPELGYAASPRTRTKVRQWFNAQQLAEQIQTGRERLDKELARLGKTAVKLEDIAQRLGYDKVDDLCVAFAKEELSTRAIEQVVQPSEAEKVEEDEIHMSQTSLYLPAPIYFSNPVKCSLR